jgi:septal ring factor EnvC (AmiA/AmiB activator)
MTGIETITAIGAAAAALKATPPVLDAGKKFLGVLSRTELKQTRQQLDDTRKALEATEQELRESETVVANLVEEVIETQAELGDVRAAYDDYRGKVDLIFWAGGSVILVLLIFLVFMSRQN